jgi:hypothetical protein
MLMIADMVLGNPKKKKRGILSISVAMTEY